MSYRKEKKYRVTQYELNLLKSILLEQGMINLYTPRQVNSIYFDTKDKNMFFDSEEGVLLRKKIRIRWYNNTQNFKLEKKISSVEGRFKKIQKLQSINGINSIYYYRPFDSHYGALFPTLKVSYNRSYYYIRGMRITFDEYIEYENLQNKSIVFKDPENVVEVKVPANFSDDAIQKVISHQSSRFSKYCRGLLFSQGQMSVM
jgi:hypothetical protein